MEGGNRAEAERWLYTANKLLSARDLHGARSFAIRARESDPTFDASELLLAVIDTLLAGESRINDHHRDWYGILQILRYTTNIDHIANQYRRLALLLDPNRNPFAFSGHAFSLVHDAWSVLSNPAKKAMYDSDLRLLTTPPVPPQPHPQPAPQYQQPPLQQPPQPNPTPRKNSRSRDGTGATATEPTPSRQNRNPSEAGETTRQTRTASAAETEGNISFWTLCPYCYVYYEYPKGYEDCTLRCQSCRRGFHAVVIRSPQVNEIDSSFCTWGFFPLGFSGDSKDVNGASSNWNPIAPLFPCSMKGSSNRKKNWVYYDEEATAAFIDISDPSDNDSDDGVLRDVERPFSNLEYTGINRERVEQMEARLKEDILSEAERYGYKILVTDELPDGQMVDQWEPVSCDSVKTPLEVYEELQVEGYLVDYERVPITDEKSPKELDFDILVHKISQADVNTEIIFNCQMGRGRTTTGMVIATLVYLNRIGASGIPRSNSMGRIFQSMTNAADHLPSSEEAIRRGEYAVIRSLVRVLEGGVDGKRQVDKVIDKCASMQNLREAIGTYRNSILRQPDEMKKEASLSFFVEYLERYYFLICFAVYINSERDILLSSTAGQSSFSNWMRARPELYSIIRRLLRRDPMGALGYSSLKPSLTKIAESSDGRPSEMGNVAALRKGEVLGSQTVLKSDHCPGCQNPSLPERVDGAPNFRKVPGFPVFGVANPTIDGIRSVIHRICSTNGGCPILWHNMREEPVIYINGKPFVLREVERPYKNMLEYTGIDCERVEKMEARLKEDILREAKQYSSAIMVIHETDDGHIFDAWEHVTSDLIQTPLEVFKSLEAEGFPIKYARVPITDGKAPERSDFDILANNIASAAKDTAFVFNCQMGRGRTTTGTVIACLVKLRVDFGRPIKILSDDITQEESNGGSSSGDEALGRVTALTSNISQMKIDEKQNRVFGINDILLLWKITTLFDNGAECREALDAVIDRCSALQNIRQAVLQYRKVFNQQHVEPRVRRVALDRGAEYLERYFRLIAFAAYLGSEAFDGFCGQGKSRMTFKVWLHQRPEVQAMKWSIRSRPGRFFTVPEELRESQESQHGDAVMESTVNARNGSVLGKGSILKMYFFPGQRTSNNIQIHGAPHVYKVDGYPVCCMATPTISGAKEMLNYLDAKSKPGFTARKVILTDVREEAVVYINCVPFVHRELNKPVDTLKHVGITGPVVEHMEARLKEDTLAEIRQSGGRMLLHREEYDPSTNQSTVVGYWENILADDVKTPAEVYSLLKDDGYDIVYRRIPLTRERDALASDVDAIQYCQDDSAGSYLFVSHTGFGGVAYAMAIICIRLGAEANFASKVLQPSFGPDTYAVTEDNSLSRASNETALRMGDYRDILNLTRVLVHGPQSKSDVDIVIERCAGAGHIRDDILYYIREFEKFTDDDDEERAYLFDMGIKALRRYFFLITFRSYLYCNSPDDTEFAGWMDARPELSHLCNNLRIDK